MFKKQYTCSQMHIKMQYTSSQTHIKIQYTSSQTHINSVCHTPHILLMKLLQIKILELYKDTSELFLGLADMVANVTLCLMVAVISFCVVLQVERWHCCSFSQSHLPTKVYNGITNCTQVHLLVNMIHCRNSAQCA
jgi:hypothetical protein